MTLFSPQKNVYCLMPTPVKEVESLDLHTCQTCEGDALSPHHYHHYHGYQKRLRSKPRISRLLVAMISHTQPSGVDFVGSMDLCPQLSSIILTKGRPRVELGPLPLLMVMRPPSSGVSGEHTGSIKEGLLTRSQII